MSPDAFDQLPLWLQCITAGLVLVGGVFTLVGAVGLLRFPDVFMRLHAPTKATTLGVGGLLLASLVLAWWQGQTGLQVLLITLFLFLTAPVSASLMAKAAVHLRLPSRAGPAPLQDAPAAPAPAGAPRPVAAAAPAPPGGTGPTR